MNADARCERLAALVVELTGHRRDPRDETYRLGLLSVTRMMAEHFGVEAEIDFGNMVDQAERFMGYAITEGKLELTA